MEAYSLERFVEAQRWDYPAALSEIKSGRKLSHWMWYIFPQMRGLGTSNMAYKFGIAGLDEARAYMAHPILSNRLIEITEELLKHKNKSAEDVFGYVDALKLKSSMTLFSLVSDEGSVFHLAIDQFFRGEVDLKTLELVNCN